MKKRLSLILVLAFTLFFSGCTAFKYLDGSTEKQIEAFRTGKPVVAKAPMPEPVEKPEVEPEPMEPVEAEPEPPEPEPVEVAAVEEPEPMEPVAVEERPIEDIKIKVLNGNGIHHAARDMRRRLEAMGYSIDRIDNAPRFTFETHSIYYDECCFDEAKTLERELGGSTIIKPLTWHSIFDIIVVTGKTP